MTPDGNRVQDVPNAIGPCARLDTVFESGVGTTLTPRLSGGRDLSTYGYNRGVNHSSVDMPLMMDSKDNHAG